MRNAIEIQREKPDADVDVMEVEGGKLKSRNSNGHRAQRHAQKFKECLVDAYHPSECLLFFLQGHVIFPRHAAPAFSQCSPPFGGAEKIKSEELIHQPLTCTQACERLHHSCGGD